MTKKRFSLSCDLEDTEIISWLNNQKNISESIRLILRKVIEEVGEQDFKDYLIESALKSISFVEPMKDKAIESVEDKAIESVEDKEIESI